MSGQAAIRLPDEVNLLKLINARKEEINSINSECRTKLPKLAQQRLPRYMRRRAASHNPKRIPKACRSKWLTSTKAPTGHSDATSEAKEKRRLKMKKHINEKKLKENIEKRNAREERSLFHVWFAKRFKMEPLWSKLVPIRNNTKNERNLHRMAKRGICYYYMSSFMKALKIRIGFNEMQLFLHQLISPESKSLIENVEDREQTVNLYEPEKYPLGLIGPVALSWSSSKCEWTVWCHVSILESVTQLLTDRFSSENLSVDVADLERIKLVGPESFEKLEKVLEQKVSFSTEDNGILFNVDVSKISELEPLCDPTSCYFQVVNDNIGDRISLDIVVEKKCARAIWNKLIVNKSHLVGGIRDLKTLYFNSSKPLFPYFGFSDAKISHEIVVHNSPWISQYLDRGRRTYHQNSM
ncbi:hypothetical protein HDE_01687 [Halotydeus destructor]|nr:hypothetical protein HDE_01687 [Halotydeus destructor]